MKLVVVHVPLLPAALQVVINLPEHMRGATGLGFPT